jgi:AraC-like DNA-binding protein
MDPLSDVLSLLKPRSYISAGFDAGGDWAIHFAGNVGIKCYAVVSGQCWLAVDDVPEPALLHGGDCFLLPGGRPFRLASDLTLPSVAAETVFAAAREGGVARHNGGGEFFLVGSRFTLSGNAGILLAMLPPIVHIRKEADQAALRWSVERMMQELRERRPGGYLMAEHLAHMMLLQALRLHMAEGGKDGVGWLFALTDRQMGAAISAMHAEPAQRWTLQTLAEVAGMSRSSFALRFKQTVGTSPLDYLTRWRMLLAGDRLTHSGESTSAIALSLGYESESAFSTAFKRVMGTSPRHYGRRQNLAPASPDDAETAAA